MCTVKQLSQMKKANNRKHNYIKYDTKKIDNYMGNTNHDDKKHDDTKRNNNEHDETKKNFKFWRGEITHLF